MWGFGSWVLGWAWIWFGVAGGGFGFGAVGLLAWDWLGAVGFGFLLLLGCGLVCLNRP